MFDNTVKPRNILFKWYLTTLLLTLLLIFPSTTHPTPFALVTDQGSGITAGKLLIINLETKTVVHAATVGTNPVDITVGGSLFAYVANSDSDSVSTVDITTPGTSPVGTITGFFAQPLNLTTTSDNAYVLATNFDINNTYGLTVITTSTNTVARTVAPTNYSPPLDLATYGNYVYVSYPDDFMIRALDISNNYSSAWERSTSPDRPGRITVTPNGTSVYALTGVTVSGIYPTYSVLPSSYFNLPDYLIFHPNGTDLYVSNKGNNTITIVDPLKYDLLATVSVGISPYGIDFNPDGTYAYVVNSGEGSISVIDTTTRSVVDTIRDPELITPVQIFIIEQTNNPPHVPSLPYPQDGATGIAVSTELSWEGGDPDGDPVTYEVFMGTNPDTGLELACSGIADPDTFCIPSTPLITGTTYYWMVKATDSYNNVSEVPYPYWSFTTAGVAPCTVTISPQFTTVGFGETIQFSASTTCSEESMVGSYLWDLTSTLGSSIDENGLYTAGTIGETDTITVTDVANGGITGSASVEVTSAPRCEVTINPPSVTVSSGGNVTLVATTTSLSASTQCNEGVYQWAIDSSIGSSITQQGIYTAGINTTGANVTDIVTVTDTANNNLTAQADITVLPQTQEDYFVTIEPLEMELVSFDQLQFTAHTLLTDTQTPIPPEECSYRWEISPRSTIGSTINRTGLYQAGLNPGDNLTTETIVVYDTLHHNVSASATVTVFVRFISFPYLTLPPGPLVTSYRMACVGPIWPIDGDAFRIVTGATEYNPYLVRLFRWDGQLDGGQGGYREYPDLPSLDPGIGIWAITLTGGFIIVDGTPVNADQPFDITLDPGWTQIGNPFYFTVDWSQVSIAGGEGSVEIPWSFVGAYLPSPFLTPWNGYFVYNNSSSPITITIPPHTPDTRVTKSYTPLSDKETGFALQLSIHHLPFFWLQDTYNFIGVAQGSLAERDSKDLHEPPPISSDQISLYFPHQWEGTSERYTADFRSLDSPQEVFECTVTPGNGIVSLLRLYWSDTVRIPQEYQIAFADPETGITLDMREINEYWFFSLSGRERHFTITLTKRVP